MWLLVPVTAVANLFVKIAYLRTRFSVLYSRKGGCTIGDQLALALEALLFTPQLLKFIARAVALRSPHRSLRPPKLKHFPSVDILIPCCNEKLTTILDTVQVVLGIDYPQASFNVIVLDDGSSEELKRKIQSLRKEHRNVYYTAREKPPVPDYKAGNLNHGVAFSAALSEKPPAFLAGLDADSVVHRHWIREAIEHMIIDANLALVITPQVRFEAL